MAKTASPKKPGRPPKGAGPELTEGIPPAEAAAPAPETGAMAAPDAGDAARTLRPKPGPKKKFAPGEGEPPVAAAAPEADELQVPTKAVEPDEDEAARPATPDGKPAVTVNIAKLQAMSMPELNGMAKEMGIENYRSEERRVGKECRL